MKMLTNSERAWLEERQQWRFRSCRWCYAFPVVSKEVAPSPCVKKCRKEKAMPYCYGFRFPSFRDAAEFEVRVAAKLAKGYPNRICIDLEKDYECPGWEVCKHRPTAHPPCAFAALMGARLAVEEEMENENNQEGI